MPDNKYSFSKIVSREEWTTQRKKLLEEEEEFTRQRDRLSAKRRGPMPWLRRHDQYQKAEAE